MSIEKEDKDAILKHCEKLSDATNQCLFESNKLDRQELAKILTQSENILLNLLDKM